MDVVADVQVQVCDLQVVRRLAHVVRTEEASHGGVLVCRRRLLGAHLLGCRGWRWDLYGGTQTDIERRRGRTEKGGQKEEVY